MFAQARTCCKNTSRSQSSNERATRDRFTSLSQLAATHDRQHDLTDQLYNLKRKRKDDELIIDQTISLLKPEDRSIGELFLKDQVEEQRELNGA